MTFPISIEASPPRSTRRHVTVAEDTIVLEAGEFRQVTVTGSPLTGGVSSHR